MKRLYNDYIFEGRNTRLGKEIIKRSLKGEIVDNKHPLGDAVQKFAKTQSKPMDQNLLYSDRVDDIKKLIKPLVGVSWPNPDDPKAPHVSLKPWERKALLKGYYNQALIDKVKQGHKHLRGIKPQGEYEAGMYKPMNKAIAMNGMTVTTKDNEPTHADPVGGIININPKSGEPEIAADHEGREILKTKRLKTKHKLDRINPVGFRSHNSMGDHAHPDIIDGDFKNLMYRKAVYGSTSETEKEREQTNQFPYIRSTTKRQRRKQFNKVLPALSVPHDDIIKNIPSDELAELGALNHELRNTPMSDPKKQQFEIRRRIAIDKAAQKVTGRSRIIDIDKIAKKENTILYIQHLEYLMEANRTIYPDGRLRYLVSKLKGYGVNGVSAIKRGINKTRETNISEVPKKTYDYTKQKVDDFLNYLVSKSLKKNGKTIDNYVKAKKHREKLDRMRKVIKDVESDRVSKLKKNLNKEKVKPKDVKSTLTQAAIAKVAGGVTSIAHKYYDKKENALKDHFVKNLKPVNSEEQGGEDLLNRLVKAKTVDDSAVERLKKKMRSATEKTRVVIPAFSGVNEMFAADELFYKIKQHNENLNNHRIALDNMIKNNAEVETINKMRNKIAQHERTLKKLHTAHQRAIVSLFIDDDKVDEYMKSRMKRRIK